MVELFSGRIDLYIVYRCAVATLSIDHQRQSFHDAVYLEEDFSSIKQYLMNTERKITIC